MFDVSHFAAWSVPDSSPWLSEISHNPVPATFPSLAILIVGYSYALKKRAFDWKA
jgi:hypothetical protein